MTVTAFSDLDLDEKLLKALQKEGYSSPTAIQIKAIPAALEGRDVLGSAPTGTGKTAAYLIPVLQHLLDFPRKSSGPPRALILVPTRELAIQVAENARALARHTRLDVATITGGVAYMNHAEVFSKNQDVVVATTGRLLQYIREGNFSCRDVEILVLDEADRMLDMGFAQDIEAIAEKTATRKQTLLFSATLEGSAVGTFARHVLNDPIEIMVDPPQQEKRIQQYYYRADSLDHKIKLLIALLQRPDVTRSIIFVRKRESVHELVSILQSVGLRASYLEGEMVQAKRADALRRLIEGKVKFLVATDVAARGLDIEDISHVFNFDLPRTADIYLHRIGRTGRAGKSGEALSLVEAHDYSLLEKIRRYTREPLKARVVEGLKPVTRAPSSKLKKKPSKKALAKEKVRPKKEDNERKRVKGRARVKKNIGKRRKPSSERALDGTSVA